MPKSLLSLFLALLLACGAAGAAESPRVVELNRIVAVVNEDVITLSELNQRLYSITLQLRQNKTPMPPMEVLRKQVLERLIIDRLQLELAGEIGVRVNDEVVNQVIANIAAENNLSLEEFRAILERDGIPFADYREEIRNELTINRLRQRQVDNRVDVSQQEVDAYLESNLLRENRNLEYKLAHILISVPEAASPEQVQAARQKAETILGELAEGADFRQLAVAYSDGQQALQGGDLGWRKAGELPTLFAETVINMDSGQTSQPIRSPSGFHLLKLMDKRGEQRHMVQQTHARHILVRTNAVTSDFEARGRLERLRERILAGEDFATLARANSDDTGSGSRGGDLGWANPGTFVGPFEEAMQSLGAGEISEPFRTQFGWHIVQVLERRQHDNTEDYRRTQAFQALHQRKREEALEDWLRRLRDEAYVEYRLEG